MARVQTSDRLANQMQQNICSIIERGFNVSSIKALNSANFTVQDTDGLSVFMVTTGTKTPTVTLPVSSRNPGRQITVRKVDSASGTIIIAAQKSDFIDSYTSTGILAQNGTVNLLSDGTSWRTVSAWDRQETSNSSFVNYPASTVTQDIGGNGNGLNLPSGTWSLSLLMSIDLNGATSGGSWTAGISTVTGNSLSGLNFGVNRVEHLPPTASNEVTVSIPSYQVNPTAMTAYFGKQRAVYSVAIPIYAFRLTAVRSL